MIKSSFTEKGEQASEVLSLIHTNVYGPINTSARGGYYYFSTSARCIWTLLDMVQSMMDFASLSIFFWGYALESAYYILNKVSSKSINKIPHEMWIRHKPILSDIRIWGCRTYIKCLKTNKLGSRFNKYNFIGYLKETKGYYFYFADE